MSAILEVIGVRTEFPANGKKVPVVDDVSFSLGRGEVLALVGESGCGKSMTALSILRLIPRPGRMTRGRVLLDGQEIQTLSVPLMRQIRGHQVSMIFQEPMTSLNPVVQVGNQVIEAIRLHERVTARRARTRTCELFERVGIPEPEVRLKSYPHQLSGGLKQRVMIAMALATRPKLLIADEPTTALDVTIQAQILGLLRELQRSLGMAILLITHDLGIVNELADRVAVMYAGRIAEEGTRMDVLRDARHPYTQGLLRSLPGLARPGEPLNEIQGTVPSALHWAPGCRFAPRCIRALDHCRERVPEVSQLNGSHRTCCHAVVRELSL